MYTDYIKAFGTFSLKAAIETDFGCWILNPDGWVEINCAEFFKPGGSDRFDEWHDWQQWHVSFEVDGHELARFVDREMGKYLKRVHQAKKKQRQRPKKPN